MMEHLLFGAAYYPEHDPEEEWELDARLMADLGLNVIRVGEFCWNRMQRSDGTPTLDWLDRLITLYDSFGIKTILCTPTATPPIWVVERFPDLSIVLPDGRIGQFGGRRHYSAFHEGYRELSTQIAKLLADRFGRHPGVIGWHIDNEVGSYGIVDCSQPALDAFHRHLANKYGSVDELNRRWGLIFWNQEVESFEQIPAPTEMMTTRSPQHILEYNRFCLEGLSDYILMQAKAIRDRAEERQWIVGSCHEEVGYTLFRKHRTLDKTLLDYVEFNNYPELLPEPAQSAMHIDRQRSIDRPRRFLTLEQQTGSGHSTSGGLDPRILTFWAWDTLARGSLSVSWFHWRRFRTGCEWRHTSIVERDRKPRAVFDSLKEFISDARKVESILVNAEVVPDVQIFIDPDSVIARDRASEETFWMEIQLPDGWRHRFPLWEKETRRAVYQPLTGYGLTLDFVQEHEEWYPSTPLIIPDLELCTESLVTKLTEFHKCGGTIICFPGVGDRNEDGAHIEAPSPGMLSGLFGVEFGDYYPLAAGSGSIYDPALGKMTAQEAPAVNTVGTISLDATDIAADVRHAEALAVKDADVLGTYKGGPCDGAAAITERHTGDGRAVYLGAVPADAENACQLYEKLLPTIACSRTRFSRVKLVSGGTRYDFLLNNSPAPCPLDGEVADMITDTTLTELPPYGVALVAGDR